MPNYPGVPRHPWGASSPRRFLQREMELPHHRRICSEGLCNDDPGLVIQKPRDLGQDFLASVSHRTSRATLSKDSDLFPCPSGFLPDPPRLANCNPELQLQLPRRQHTALVLLQRILPFSLSLAEGFDAGANLGYSAVLQTLLQLQLIIHSGCQWPRRQEREGND